MAVEQIHYEGVAPIFLMVLKDPDIWDLPCSVETIGRIWEKINLKPKKYINVESQVYIEIHSEALGRYTELVHLYNSYSEEVKDQMADDWNKSITWTILKS
jgi:hypothetical protein